MYQRQCSQTDTFKITQIFNPNALRRRWPNSRAYFLPDWAYTSLHFAKDIYLANALTPVYSVLPVLFIMTVTGIKDAYENYRKERSDDEINSQAGFHHLI